MLPLPLQPAECTHVVLVPAVWALVRSATRLIQDEYEDLPCAGAELADFDAVHFSAAESLAQCDNSADVPVETFAALSPLLLPLVVCTHVAPVPVVLVLVCCATLCPVWFARLLCVAVVGTFFGVAAQTAPVALAP